MIYPAQTSLIPIHIALARFLENQGWLAIFTSYPFWYLGTTPFRFLTSPILPTLIVILHRFLPLNLFEIFLGLVGLIFPLGAVGIYFLVRELKGNQISASLAAVFYLLGPIVPFLFRFSDGLYLIVVSFLPFMLLAYLRLLRRWSRKKATILSLIVAFLILLDVSIIPTLILAMAAIFLAKTGWKRVEERLKQTFYILFFAFLISTLCYTPGYWLVLLQAPSLGGVGVFRAIEWLGKLLPTALAFGISLVTVKFFKKRSLFRDFCFFWLFIFGFMTLIRFLSDPDFWLDWIAYGIELQMGIGMTLGLVLSRIKRPWQTYAKVIMVIFFVANWLIVVKVYVIDTFQTEIEGTVEYQIGQQLIEIVEPGEKVFLSGTTAFWLNAFFDIPQVRGGVDEAAVHPAWDQATWEIREGTKVERSEKWLKDLDVAYVVVHDQTSEEFYHDFRYPEKFERGNFQRLYYERGNAIYKLVDE